MNKPDASVLTSWRQKNEDICLKISRGNSKAHTEEDVLKSYSDTVTHLSMGIANLPSDPEDLEIKGPIFRTDLVILTTKISPGSLEIYVLL